METPNKVRVSHIAGNTKIPGSLPEKFFVEEKDDYRPKFSLDMRLELYDTLVLYSKRCKALRSIASHLSMVINAPFWALLTTKMKTNFLTN